MGTDRYLIAVNQLDRLSTLQRTNADFGSLQVLQNRDWTAKTRRDCPYAFDDKGVFLVRTMREVEARDIHPCSHQRLELFPAVRGRTYRTDNLCTAHVIIPLVN
jgi:hypothetical protein